MEAAMLGKFGAKFRRLRSNQKPLLRRIRRWTAVAILAGSLTVYTPHAMADVYNLAAAYNNVAEITAQLLLSVAVLMIAGRHTYSDVRELSGLVFHRRAGRFTPRPPGRKLVVLVLLTLLFLIGSTGPTVNHPPLLVDVGEIPFEPP
jgi:hypothetical protein